MGQRPEPIYRDRQDAGRQLAERLHLYAERPDVLVLALPRGGVPVAYEVAVALNAPLDVFVVRKLGIPKHEEAAFGAIASGGVRVVNQITVDNWQISRETIAAVTDRELRELERRERLYRGNQPPLDVGGKTIILIDDGLATGATMVAAVEALNAMQPVRLIVAVPLAPIQTCDSFRDRVDEVICAATPEPFYAVGLWYAEFDQTTDDEVAHLLKRAPIRR